jgi:heme/copper-type cytochrome/quinol oxidase subunit 3
MAETAQQPPAGLTREAEEAGFYHEAALNAAWTGARLALGGLTFGLGSFVFAFFYLRSLNSHQNWYPAGFKAPQAWVGIVVLLLIVVSAVVQALALQRIKAGRKGAWQAGALVALVFGLAAIGIQIWQLNNLPFWPGSSGFASCFVGFWPVFMVLVFCAMVWLETLIMRVRSIPEMAFVEQPPTYAEAFAVQRFQASLSAFTVVWNYLAVAAIIAWVLFYLVH